MKLGGASIEAEGLKFQGKVGKSVIFFEVFDLFFKWMKSIHLPKAIVSPLKVSKILTTILCPKIPWGYFTKRSVYT